MILKHIPQKALIVDSIHIDKLLNGSVIVDPEIRTIV